MEIDLEKAKERFLEYTEIYDLDNENIKRKQVHSLRVMKISEKIAKSINLSEQEVKVATLIGLLHDIARFEQYTKYHTYNDLDSIDHGDLGVQILEKDLRNYIETDKYDNIIKEAIKNHNKYQISEEITDKENLFAKIIRDADKIDILYQSIDKFGTVKKEKIKKLKISEDAVEEFKKLKSIRNKKEQQIENDIEVLIKVIALIFDINFKISFQILKERDNINKILCNCEFKNENTKKLMEEVRNIANTYIEEKTK